MKAKVIIISFILIVVLGAVKLAFNEYTMIGEKQDGAELFSDNSWNDIKRIAFLDFDETRYETEDIQKIQEIKDILFSLTYKKIKNPELEGWYIFEIITDEENYELNISRDIVTIKEQTYRISEKTLAEQLIGIITYDENE